MPSTTPSLRELFEATLDIPAPQRHAFLSAHCADATARERIERMLDVDPNAAALPDVQAEELALAIGETESAPALPSGTRIGTFELIKLIGEGGSSTVFHAFRRTEGVRQDVALKLLRRGLYSPEDRRQFRRERAALAQLRHPNIARLIEGGVTDSGVAYIALELVTGTAITAYARAQRLDLRSRLQLFLQVCRAVESAHRALIVHRDLKPSNVLVTEDAQVKLLDFGVAKLLDGDDETQTRMPAFTPAYAAPEQLNGALITTATDVYSLGVLLGEIVTGQRLNDGSGRTPSAHISEDAEPGMLPAPARVARRQLRGDLDNIVLKALDEQPERRYVSAGALAEDIERYLAGRPILAHPPSRLYKTRKFIQRHRGGVAATVLFALAIFAAFALALWQADVARHEAQRANAVRKFLIEVFDAAKTTLPSNQRPSPEALVREASRRARNDPSIQPETRADFLRTLGTVSLTMGDYALAEALLDEALKRQDEAGVAAGSPERLDTLVQKSSVLQRTNRNTMADAMLAELLPELRRQDSDVAADGLMLYATTRLYGGHTNEALEIAKEVAVKAARRPGPDTLEAVKIATFPGQVCVVARRWKESASLLEPAIARWRALGVPLDIDFAQALNNLATAKEHVGEHADAEALYRESIALRRRIYEGRANDRLASAQESFAIFLIRQERFDEAQALLDEALATNREVLGPENLETASTLDTLGTLEASQRHFEASEKHLREALALYIAHVAEAGQQDNDLAITRMHLAQTLIERGALEEAASLNALALAALRAQNGDIHELVAAAIALSARIAFARSDATSALAISEQSLAMLAALDHPVPRVEVSARQVRAKALAAQDRHEDALTDANLALATERAAAPEAHSKLAALLVLRARQEQALGRADAAADTIAEARALHVPAQLLAPEDATTLAVAAH